MQISFLKYYQLSQVHNKLFLFQIVNYKQANTIIAGWLDDCMMELETESFDEDIIDVDKKKQLRKENLKIMIILMKEANLSAHQFD